MSADDFQTKYASVMESMLRSAVAETTKLFETMVDELKAEISKMKQENEDLKRRCSQFESARGQTTDPSRDREPVPRQTDDSDKRDEAVQCDLAPASIPEEQSEPSRPSLQQNQDQPCENIAVQHVWQEHNYEFRGKRHFRKALSQEKQGTVDSPQQSDLRNEEAETISRGSSNKECTKAENPSSQRKEEAEVAPERSSLRVHREIPTAHNQSSEQEPSQHASRASEPAPSDKGKAPDECESNVLKDEASAQSFTHIIPKRGRPSKKVLQEQVKHIPSPSSEEKKTVKTNPKRTRKNIDSSAAVDAVSTASPKATKGSPIQSRRSSSRGKTYSKDVENRRVGSFSRRGQRSSENEEPASLDVDRASEASSTDVLPTAKKQKTSNTLRNKSPRAPADQTRERLTSVTLQDALLLVEAMNQSTEENTPLSSQASAVTTKSVQTVVEIETQIATGDKPLTKLRTTQLRQKEQNSDHQTIEKVHVEPERRANLAKTQEAAGDKPLAQLSTTARMTRKKQNSNLQTLNATATNEALSCKQVDIQKQDTDMVPLTNTPDTSRATSTAATQTITKSLQPRLSVYQMKPVVQSKQGGVMTQKIVVMSSSVASAIPQKFSAQSPAQPPTVTSTHVDAQKSEPPSLTSKDVPLKKSVSPQKTIPAATSKSSAAPTESKSGSLIHPKITIIVPRQVSAAARKPSQTIPVSAMQEAKSSDTVKSPSSQPKSSSQELGTSGDKETTTGEMPPILSTKQTSDSSESFKQTNSSSDPVVKPSETSCSSNVSLGHEPCSMSPVVPLTADQKLSVFVRLTRLQYPKSPNDTIVLSSPPTEGPSVIKPLSNEDATVDETLFGAEQTQPSETQELYSDISDTEETSATKSPSKEAAAKEVPSHIVIQTSDTQVEYSDISSDSETVSEIKSPSIDGATEKKPSPMVKPTHSFETQGTYSDVSDSEETPVHVSLTRPLTLEKQIAAQKKTSSSGKSICVEDSTTPSTIPTSVCAKSTTEISSSEPSDMADESTFSTLEKKMVSTPEQYSELPIDPPIEQDSPTTEEESPAVVHRMTIDVKDTCDPHLQMTKTQFLAQLAVSPIVQDSEKPSTNDLEDANTCSPKTSTAFKKELQKKEFVAKFRRHLKTHMQGGNLERNREPCTKTETLTRGSIQPTLDQDGPSEKSTSKTIPLNPRLRGTALDSVLKKAANDPTPVSARGSETSTDTCTETETLTKSCKKARIEKDSPEDNSLTVKLGRLNPKIQEPDMATASENTTDVPTPISTRSGTSADGVRSKKSLNDLTPAAPMRSKTAVEFTLGVPKRFRSSGDTVSKEKLLSLESVRRSSPAIESAVARKSKKASDIPGMSGSTQQSASLKNRKNTSVSPRGSGSTKDTPSPRPTRNTSVSPKRPSTEKRKGSASPKRIKTPPVNLKRASSTRDGPSLKSNKTLNPTDTDTPKWTRFSPSGPGASGLSKSSISPKKTANDAVSLRNTKSGVNLQSAGGLKLAEDKTGESTPKKPKVVQESSAPRQIIKVVHSKLSSKAPKDKTDTKTKKSLTDQPGEANASQPEENCADTENERRMSTSVVWTPPVLPKSKKASAGKSKVKKETDSPNEPVVYPPSVSLHPIPFRGPPVVSPLQPLSVIGWRLLKNQCGECGRVLSSSAALESHVSLHTGRRPFSCSLCGKGFPDSKGLKRHGRVHRNGRIHVCQQCGKGFVYSFGLTKHLQMVHGRIKPFVCQICNKGFFSKRDVEAHIRIHTGEKPFHCNLCEKKFARRTELNMHLRWHNGEKRHWCPYCGKGFLDVNNLKRHKYIHTGERPHACSHCPKTFTQSGHLKKHLKNVHKVI